MTGSHTRWTLSAVVVVVALLGPVLALPASGQTVMKNQIPDWQQIVSQSVSIGPTGDFAFSIADAASIPASPPLAEETVLDIWWFCINVNRSFTVGGWPLSNGASLPCQYFVILWWDGSIFAATTVNRTPMLIGESPVVTVIPFTIAGATVSWPVPPALLGSPASFVYAVATEDRSGAIIEFTSPTTFVLLPGNNGFQIMDIHGWVNGPSIPWP